MRSRIVLVALIVVMANITTVVAKSAEKLVANKVGLLEPIEEQYGDRVTMALETLRRLDKLPATVPQKKLRGTLIAQIAVESSGDPSVVSDAMARGLMQIKPDTFDEMTGRLPLKFSDDYHHEYENILVGAAYLTHLMQWYELTLTQALVAYNAGVGNLQTWMENGDFVPEQFIYVRKVRALREELERRTLAALE